jgi:hypothetical protein
MTQTLNIPPHERGTVRVFTVGLDGAAAEAFAADPDAFAGALGIATIDAEYVDVFPVSRLAGLGLATYLSEGHGIPPEDLAGDKETLDALEGYLAVVTSRAFGDGGQTLSIEPPLRHVGTYAEDRPVVAFGDLPSGGAARTGEAATETAPRPAETTRRPGTLLAAVLAILVFLALVVLWGGR